MRHIHRRNVCPHGYEGLPCHTGVKYTAVGHADCDDTACPSVTTERHAYTPHKSGINCTCGFGPDDKKVHY
jgi:hypothetical protein